MRKRDAADVVRGQSQDPDTQVQLAAQEERIPKETSAEAGQVKDSPAQSKHATVDKALEAEEDRLHAIVKAETKRHLAKKAEATQDVKAEDAGAKEPTMAKPGDEAELAFKATVEDAAAAPISKPRAEIIHDFIAPGDASEAEAGNEMPDAISMEVDVQEPTSMDDEIKETTKASGPTVSSIDTPTDISKANAGIASDVKDLPAQSRDATVDKALQAEEDRLRAIVAAETTRHQADEGSALEQAVSQAATEDVKAEDAGAKEPILEKPEDKAELPSEALVEDPAAAIPKPAAEILPDAMTSEHASEAKEGNDVPDAISTELDVQEPTKNDDEFKQTTNASDAMGSSAEQPEDLSKADADIASDVKVLPAQSKDATVDKALQAEEDRLRAIVEAETKRHQAQDGSALEQAVSQAASEDVKAEDAGAEEPIVEKPEDKVELPSKAFVDDPTAAISVPQAEILQDAMTSEHASEVKEGQDMPDAISMEHVVQEPTNKDDETKETTKASGAIESSVEKPTDISKSDVDIASDVKDVLAQSKDETMDKALQAQEERLRAIVEAETKRRQTGKVEAAEQNIAEAASKPKEESEPKARSEEEMKEANEVVEAPPEHALKFDGINLDGIDQDLFKDELRQKLVQNGLSPEQSNAIDIELRSGSVIAIMRGPVEVLSTVKAMDPQSLSVMGCAPYVVKLLREQEMESLKELTPAAPAQPLLMAQGEVHRMPAQDKHQRDAIAQELHVKGEDPGATERIAEKPAEISKVEADAASEVADLTAQSNDDRALQAEEDRLRRIGEAETERHRAEEAEAAVHILAEPATKDVKAEDSGIVEPTAAQPKDIIDAEANIAFEVIVQQPIGKVDEAMGGIATPRHHDTPAEADVQEPVATDTHEETVHDVVAEGPKEKDDTAEEVEETLKGPDTHSELGIEKECISKETPAEAAQGKDSLAESEDAATEKALQPEEDRLGATAEAETKRHQAGEAEATEQRVAEAATKDVTVEDAAAKEPIMDKPEDGAELPSKALGEDPAAAAISKPQAEIIHDVVSSTHASEAKEGKDMPDAISTDVDVQEPSKEPSAMSLPPHQTQAATEPMQKETEVAAERQLEESPRNNDIAENAASEGPKAEKQLKRLAEHVQEPAVEQPIKDQESAQSKDAVVQKALQAEEDRLRAILEAEMKERQAQEAEAAERRATEASAAADREAAEEAHRLKQLEEEAQIQQEQGRLSRRSAQEEQKALAKSAQEELARLAAEETSRQARVQAEERHRQEAEEKARARALAHEEARLRKEDEEDARQAATIDESDTRRQDSARRRAEALQKKAEQLRHAAEEEAKQRAEEEERRREEAAEISARRKQEAENQMRRRAQVEEDRRQAEAEAAAQREQVSAEAQQQAKDAAARAKVLAQEANAKSEHARSARKSASEAASRVSDNSDTLGRLFRTFVSTAAGTLHDLAGTAAGSSEALDPARELSMKETLMSGQDSSLFDLTASQSDFPFQDTTYHDQGRTGPPHTAPGLWSAQEPLFNSQQKPPSSAPVVPPLWEPHPRTDGFYGWHRPASMSEGSDSLPPSGFVTARDDEDAVPTFVPSPGAAQSTMDDHVQPHSLAVPDAAILSAHAVRREEDEQAEDLPVFVPISSRSGEGRFCSAARESYDTHVSTPSPRSTRSSAVFARGTEAFSGQQLVNPSLISQLCSLLNPPETPPGEDDRLLRGGRLWSDRSEYYDARPHADAALSALVIQPTAGKLSEQASPSTVVPRAADLRGERVSLEDTSKSLRGAVPQATSSVPDKTLSSSGAREHVVERERAEQPSVSPAQLLVEAPLVDRPPCPRFEPAMSEVSSSTAWYEPLPQAHVGDRERDSRVPSLPLQGIHGGPLLVQPLKKKEAAAAAVNKEPVRLPDPSPVSDGNDAFSRLTAALCKGADALLDSSRSGSSGGSQASWMRPRRSPRPLPMVDSAFTALALHPNSDWGVGVRQPSEPSAAESHGTEKVHDTCLQQQPFSSSEAVLLGRNAKMDDRRSASKDSGRTDSVLTGRQAESLGANELQADAELGNLLGFPGQFTGSLQHQSSTSLSDRGSTASSRHAAGAHYVPPTMHPAAAKPLAKPLTSGSQPVDRVSSNPVVDALEMSASASQLSGSFLSPANGLPPARPSTSPSVNESVVSGQNAGFGAINDFQDDTELGRFLGLPDKFTGLLHYEDVPSQGGSTNPKPAAWSSASSAAAVSLASERPLATAPSKESKEDCVQDRPSNTAALTQELLGNMQAQIRRPTEAELSAMAGRVAAAKRMTHSQEVEIREMLRGIANALFGDVDATHQPSASSSPPKPPSLQQRPSSGGAGSKASGGSAMRTMRSATPLSSGQGASQLPTARSSVVSEAQSASASGILGELHEAESLGRAESASASSHLGDPHEALDFEVDGLMNQLYGVFDDAPSGVSSQRSRSS
eukprot:TRINITY_DN11249_c0_g1_i2.p1 TRINITY_DN11249_c0_g1~~TRINITY_DN11249_c0_g1_i2.p1  ORF type:complete len:2635 (+),score=690.02 TRINITY_DN11249_c0_g1_i2:601-7905(+)